MGLLGHLARPLTPKSGAKAIVFLGRDNGLPRNAALDVRVGSIATKIDHSGHFRLSLNSGSTEDIALGPFRAKGGSGGCKSRKEQSARERLSNSNLMISDQAAINAGFDFRQ
jgi:hypothetical protein